MELLALSFLAGALTTLAPCILPLLPIIVGGSLGPEKHWRKPFVVTASLALSVIFFTLILRASTMFLGVPTFVWQSLSGVVIIFLGVTLLAPSLWERLGATGAALGPVFSSCSPTYAFIVASVIPASFSAGLAYLSAYALGLSAVLLLVALLGQQLVSKLQWASNPKGWFKRALGVMFIVVGVFVATGLDHQLQAYFIEQGWYDPFAKFEQSLLK
jgi:cytochrome c-type biogenesis protein